MEGGVLDLTFLYGDEDDVGVPGAKIILLGQTGAIESLILFCYFLRRPVIRRIR